ncbi:hypothetical protein NC652_015546 [Populus alba x Populus x berolinensis]|nr:hypothetical protein NC652_015546 [Populus alba x Populus x berolinensis]
MERRTLNGVGCFPSFIESLVIKTSNHSHCCSYHNFYKYTAPCMTLRAHYHISSPFFYLYSPVCIIQATLDFSTFIRNCSVYKHRSSHLAAGLILAS